MNTIKRTEVKKEIKNLKKIVNQFQIMTPKICKELEEKGYELCDLGTGTSAYTCSRVVNKMDIKSRFYLNGKFLVAGLSNRRYGKGSMYRGYVKKIV